MCAQEFFREALKWKAPSLLQFRDQDVGSGVCVRVSNKGRT